MQTDIKNIASKQFDLLVKELPDQKRYGGDLFLGKNYAKSNLLFLGINPGLDEDLPFKTELLESNVLLDGGSKIRYWNNAATALANTQKLKEKFNLATYSFCCPFRTPTWSDLDSKKREILIDYSRPILKKMLEECNPDFIVVAGRASVNILFRSYSEIFTENKEYETVKLDRFHQWSAHKVKISGKSVTVLQAPHFSYASNKEKLHNFSTWLSDKIYS